MTFYLNIWTASHLQCKRYIRQYRDVRFSNCFHRDATRFSM